MACCTRRFSWQPPPIYKIWWSNRRLNRQKRVKSKWERMWSNEPCTLPLIVELVTGWMKRPAPQVVAATTRNAMTFFRLYKQPNLKIREDIWISKAFQKSQPMETASLTSLCQTVTSYFPYQLLNISSCVRMTFYFVSYTTCISEAGSHRPYTKYGGQTEG